MDAVSPTPPTVHGAPVDELDARTLYAILALRSQVFVVEQDCVYLDPDGRDVEPGARHLWIADGEQVSATLRMLDEPDGTARIGRVVTAPDARGRGLAALLMTAALDRVPAERPVVLGAQAHLADWYARFGFRAAGEVYDEDGIAHVPMRREAHSTPGPTPTREPGRDMPGARP